MSIKPTASTTIGIDIGESSIKIAALKYQRGRISIERIQEFELDKEKNIEIFQSKVKEFVDSFKDPLIVSSASGEDVIVRNVDLTLTKEKDLESALPFQIEPLVPYPIDEAIFDKIVCEKSKERTRLTTLSIHERLLADHMGLMDRLGLEPEVVSCSPVALTNLVKVLFAEPPPIILHLGAKMTACLRVDKGSLVAARAIKIGFRDFSEALAKDEKISHEEAERKLSEEVDFSSIEKSRHPNLAEAKGRFIKELSRSLYSIKTKEDRGHFKGAFVSGGFVLAKGADKFLEKEIGLAIISAPEPNLFDVDRNSLRKFSVAIGAALGCLPSSKDLVDFRKKRFAYKDPWRRLKKPVIQYLALSVATAFLIFFIGGAVLHKKEVKIKKAAAEFFSSADGKDGQEKILLKNVRLKELDSKIAFFEQNIAKAKSPISLYPNVFLVSDFLDWFEEKGQALSENEEDREVQMESFSYTLVTRPTEKNKKAVYKVKVEMDLTFSETRFARAFHDILLKAKGVVVANSVKWDAGKDVYKTSFELKNRSRPKLKEVVAKNG